MRCSYCGKVSSCVNKFILHLQYAHKTDNYECPFNSCSRSFHRRDNFKKHLLLEHKSQLNNNKFHSNETLYTGMPEINSEGSYPNFEIANENQKINNHSDKQSFFSLNEKLNEFQTTLKSSILELVSKLYMENSIPRNFIQKIIEYIKSFLHSGFIRILKDTLTYIINNPEVNINKTDVLSQMCDGIIDSLNFVDTDYKRLKFFEESEMYVSPIPHVVGFSQDVSKKNNESSLVIKERTCINIDISKTLKIFLEMPGVFDKIQSYHYLTYVKKIVYK